MRRGTLIALIVLLLLLAGAAWWQIRLASRDATPLPGPTVTGQLPEPGAPSPAP